MLRLYNVEAATPTQLEWSEVFSYAAEICGVEEDMTLYQVQDANRMYIYSAGVGITCHVDYDGTMLDLFVMVVRDDELSMPYETHINISDPNSIERLGAFLKQFVSMRRNESLVGRRSP